MSRRGSRSAFSFFHVSLGLAVVCALALMAVRIGSVFSLSGFPLVTTSGAEEEAVLGIWRAVHGGAYADPLKIPFAASYYNWLFFQSYGSVTQWALEAHGLPPDAFATVGRLLTLCGLALGGGLMAWGMRLCHGSFGVLPGLLVAYACLGPLIGWWAVSLHPEIWATTLSLAAALVMMAFYERTPVRAVVLASFISFLAWSFKQSHLYVALAMGLFLLQRRDWAGVALAVALHLAGLGLTLKLGSEAYLRSIVLAGASDYSWESFRHVLLNLLPKAGAIVLMAGAVLWTGETRTALWRNVPGRFLLFATVSCLTVAPMTAKIGASETYYMPLISFLTLLAARFEPERGGIRETVIGLAWLAHGALCIGVLGGWMGVASVAGYDPVYREQRACVRDLPSPMWSFHPYLSLPWMHPEGPHFILAYDYATYLKRGMALEAGGAGGMVASGAFASLVFRHGTPERTIDGVDIGVHYALDRENCAGLDIYRLKSR